DSLLEQMIESLRTHQETLDEHTARLASVREERIAAEREFASKGAELSSAEARLNSLRGEISAATGRRESGETRLHLLQNEIETASRSAAEISANLEDLKRRSDAAHLALEHAQAETASAMADHENAQQQRQSTEAILNTAGKEAAGLESRLEVLRQLQEQGEGLDEGTQALLKGLDNPDFFQSAIKGTLAQHIQVEERLIPAIEAALGSALQAVIFKDPGVAEAALATLSGKKLGRAAVIPASWISGKGEQASRLFSQTPETPPTPGHPVVLGKTPRDPAKKTVLIYGHYDVQPPEPLELWTTPPFDPQIRDGKIYGRGASDNKGQILSHILGVGEALAEGPLPVNVIFLIEGEEEVGSGHLVDFLKKHRAELECDAIAISDTGMAADGHPTLSYALRGIAAMEVRVCGPSHDLHSGIYGGAVANPATAAARLIASLHDSQGRVAIEGFYDDVQPMQAWEREAAAESPVTDQAIAEQAGVTELWGEQGFSSVERIGARPT
ncbi:MAG: M20/M25/M40 family metallo-hydrolase, partial [Spartobacteria bacterium]